MIFDKIIESDIEEKDDIDALVDPDPTSANAIDQMAEEVEKHMASAALESVTFFEGGEEAVKQFSESVDELESVNEARRLVKKTFVRLNKNDDLQRRSHLACLVLAKAHKDPLWTKLALNRVKERKLRNAIYKKYENKAKMVARKSQQIHIKNSRKLPALPKIQF